MVDFLTRKQCAERALRLNNFLGCQMEKNKLNFPFFGNQAKYHLIVQSKAKPKMCLLLITRYILLIGSAR